MIRIGDQAYDLSDPAIVLVIAAGAVALLVLMLLFAALRGVRRQTDAVAPLAQHMGFLNQRVQALSDGQQQLAGGLNHVSEAQAASQSNLL